MSAPYVPYIGTAVVLVGSFAGSSVFAEHRAGRGPQAVAVLASLTVMVAGICASLYESLVGGFQCDDHCAGTGGWRGVPGAWQWDVFVCAGIVGALISLTVFLLACSRSYRSARIASAVAFVVYVVPLIL